MDLIASFNIGRRALCSNKQQARRARQVAVLCVNGMRVNWSMCMVGGRSIAQPLQPQPQQTASHCVWARLMTDTYRHPRLECSSLRLLPVLAVTEAANVNVNYYLRQGGNVFVCLSVCVSAR